MTEKDNESSLNIISITSFLQCILSFFPPFVFHHVRNKHNLKCTKMRYAPPKILTKGKPYLQPLCLVQSLSSTMYCSYLQELI